MAVSSQEKSRHVTGVVTYNERIGLAKDAKVHIRLEDHTDRQDAAVVVAEQTVLIGYSQAPISFSLSFPGSRVKTNHSYSVSAEIEMGGRVWLRGRKLLRAAPTKNLRNITIAVSSVE
jgi:uncharacterized lipoprotein YbaY